MNIFIQTAQRVKWWSGLIHSLWQEAWAWIGGGQKGAALHGLGQSEAKEE